MEEHVAQQSNESVRRLKEQAAALAAGKPDARPLDLGEDELEFGQRLADSLGAEMSDEHDGKPKDPDREMRETRMAEAARPQDYKAKLAEMSFDEQLEATLECLERKNNQKEILYDLLVYCLQERTEAEAEQFLEAHKQFADGYHTASKYLLFMQRTGAIDELAYDEAGQLVTDQVRAAAIEEGMSPEDADELAVAWSYKTTEVGEAAIEAFDPAKRTRAMLATQKTSRLASYRRLLEFCEQPRSLEEIVSFMDGDPGLEIDSRTGSCRCSPAPT